MKIKAEIQYKYEILNEKTGKKTSKTENVRIEASSVNKFLASLERTTGIVLNEADKEFFPKVVNHVIKKKHLENNLVSFTTKNRKDKKEIECIKFSILEEKKNKK